MSALFPDNLSRSDVSEEDQRRIRQVFQECDSGRKGYLSRGDLKVAILSIFGYKPSKYEVEQLMGIGSKDQNQLAGLALDRFQRVMCAKLSLEDPEQEIRQMFNLFDAECKGFLTVHDIREAFASSTPNMLESTVLSCFENMDKDGDGRISFRDFEQFTRLSSGNCI